MAIPEENIKQEVKEDAFSSSNDGLGLKEESNFCFKFKFPTYEEFSKNRGGFEACSAANTSKYEFMSAKSFSGVIVEPKVMSFRVEEVNRDINDGFSLDKCFGEVHSKEITEDSSNGVSEKVETEEIGESLMTEENVKAVIAEKRLETSHLDSILTHLIDSYGDDFLSVGEFDPLKIEDENRESHHQNVETFNSNFLSEKAFDEQLEKPKINDKLIDHCSYDSEKLKGSVVFDSEETNKLETLWEHQELIDQLKMEIKKVRDTGLPTILEETECPKVIMEDLKTWKIDDKFRHENPMSELQKLYKSYRERMRKFDILNYQKMYALGLLQLQDPLQSITTPKSPAFEFKSFISQNFSPQKRKKDEDDPTTKYVKELQSDLEVIYVGQMCLSWEFLHWQYGKSLDIWESDDHRICKFNEVAGEFQQFQVLMQRFIEDEPFQGPRVQNYVKNRCVLRNLLQAPVIREDRLKDKKKARLKERNEYDITSDMLVEIIEESIRIFWKFVRADKDCKNVIAKNRKEIVVELQDPMNFELLSDVLENLEKKERKLKEHLRSGNCILKKLRKRREEKNSDEVLYFFSQVDMKLVSRVLNMSRLTTEQLVWCESKLSNISFVNRKIHVQPSFLLFPC